MPHSPNSLFTGKERDAETGLDYFGARYYGSNIGRFSSADPLLGSLNPADPQTLNRYSYVMNHPLALVDPDGLWAVDRDFSYCKDDAKCLDKAKQEADELEKKTQQSLDAIADAMMNAAMQGDADAISALGNALQAYGNKGDDKVVIQSKQQFDAMWSGKVGKLNSDARTVSVNKGARQFVGMNNSTSGYLLPAKLAHEGVHMWMYQQGSAPPHGSMPYRVEGWMAHIAGVPDVVEHQGEKYVLSSPSWSKPDARIKEAADNLAKATKD